MNEESKHLRLVDTHCHLQDAAFDSDRGETLSRALDALEWIVVVGDDLDASKQAVKLGGPRVFAVIGFHPYHAAQVDSSVIASLRDLASNPCVRAIGEIGLDYHNVHAPPEVQQSAFRAQLDLACELRLPVVIHNRDSHADVSTILDEYHSKLAGGIMHCFDGDTAFVTKCMDWGFHVSFAGNVTYPKAENLREAARAVPMDRLLVETDSPYLAPQPMRGRRCEPAYVQHTAAALALVKGSSPEEFASRTTENASRLFGVTQPV
ncbi:MAG: TatD family hydrolase [Candidatus Hydrogenedentes bacterium]|nr:TatD family hydrolase [Candidatus Hydrogenedentota bacterium]